MSSSNKKYFPVEVKIVVSEPWDFKVENSNNILTGTIKKEIFRDKKNKYYLTEINKQFIWKNSIVEFVVVSSKTVGHEIEEIFEEHNDIVVAICRVKDKELINKGEFSFDNIEYFAIGTLSVD